MSTNTLTPREGAIKSGESAPDFTLKDQNKADWSLADHIKKGDVVLAFFPFAFTGVCGTEMKCITKELAEWSARGATVVGVSCDSMFTLKAWADAEQFTHTLLSDQQRAVTKAYGIHWPDMNTTQRATIVIGKSPDGRGTVKWVQTRPPGNAMNWDEVLKAIA